MPAPQSKDYLQPTFQSGWIIQRATDTNTDSCIVLDNFRVEPDGSLRGRQGITVINEEQLTDGSSTRVHSHRRRLCR